MAAPRSDRSRSPAKNGWQESGGGGGGSWGASDNSWTGGEAKAGDSEGAAKSNGWSGGDWKSNDGGGGGWKDGGGGGGSWSDSASGKGGKDSGKDGGKGKGGKDGKDGKGKGGKMEDWECPGCGVNVFAKKDSCFKCGAKRDGSSKGDGGAGAEICRFFAKAGWCKSGDKCVYKHEKGSGGHEGDWDCPSCGDKQFARNQRCRKCGALRPGAEVDEKECKEAAMTERYISSIKVFQRVTDFNKETWWWWCDCNGYKGKYDPRRKEHEFLKDFVESQKVPLEEENGGGNSQVAGMTPSLPGLMGAGLPGLPPGMPSPEVFAAAIAAGLPGFPKAMPGTMPAMNFPFPAMGGVPAMGGMPPMGGMMPPMDPGAMALQMMAAAMGKTAPM